MREVILPFATFAFLAILFKIIVNNKGKKEKKFFDQYLEEEFNANFSRAVEIPKELFFVPKIELLPIKEYENDSKYEQIIKLQNAVIKKSTEKMIILDPPLSNKEIKLKYGANNLETIINCEENYNSFINSINNLSEELINLKNYPDAEQFLLYCVEIKSLYFKTYELLIKIYIETNQNEKIKNLKEEVQNMAYLDSDLFLKEKIIKNLDIVN